jgi:hypothetical protein
MAKALAPAGRTRLGGRDERRAVYRNFQSCVITAFASHVRLTEWRYVRFTPFAFRSRLAAADRAVEAHAAMQDALADLLLVGNDKPRQAAVATALAIQDINLNRSPASRGNKAAAVRFWDELESYIEACQEDLWYLPRWWQVWRPTWWSARWKSLRKRRRRQNESAIASSPE